MTPEALPTETEIDLDQLDSREFPKLDRATLEKIAATLSQKHDAINQENRDRQAQIDKLQFELTDQSGKLPLIGYLAKVAQKAIDKQNVESQLLQDVKDLRPIADRINSLSKQLYDELAAYLSEVSRIERLQKTVDFKAEFLSRVTPGDLPTIEHSEGSNQFQLKTIDAASYQRQNRTSAFQNADFGFADHLYRAKESNFVTS